MNVIQLGGISGKRSALSLEHIRIEFGGLVAIADMSFSVNEGELVSLIGPNGAGKTTAFNIITGYLSLQKGRFTIKVFPLLA